MRKWVLAVSTWAMRTKAFSPPPFQARRFWEGKRSRRNPQGRTPWKYEEKGQGPEEGKKGGEGA